MIIALLMFYDHEERHKFHDYQGPQGVAICSIRVVFFIVFMIGLVSSYIEVRQGLNAQMMDQER